MKPSRRIQRGGCMLVMLLLASCGGLPKGGPRTASTAMKPSAHTALAATVRPKVAAHPGKTGLHSLADAHDAFAARLALVDAAECSLDVQYFIWNKDMTGEAMIERLLRAADRGVRVRLLLDDLGARPPEAVLLTIDSHPNIELRMFNPVAFRSLRALGMAADFARINKRMHNKSLIADGEVAIVGGRNIGDEYYEANAGSNFADLDVALIGPAVREASEAFDLYWNHAAAIPIGNLSRKKITPAEYAQKRAELAAHYQAMKKSEYAKWLHESEFAEQFRRHAVTYSWGRATIVEDHPDKVLTSSSDRATHLAPQLLQIGSQTKRELFLVSPYFVPRKEGVKFLADARRRGARVVVLTNSLAATDGIAVHSGYRRYRRPLLEAGVELYEVKPTATTGRGKRRGGGIIGSRGSGASSGTSLHAKTFAFDRRYGFIGSYNLDPRSSRLNTEMGVLFDCPEMARRLPETVEPKLPDNAYHVVLEGRRVVWVTREGGKMVRYTEEPQTTLWKRLNVSLLALLPLEGLL